MKRLSWYYYWYYRGQTAAGMPRWVESTRMLKLLEPKHSGSAADQKDDTLVGSEQQAAKEER